MIFSPGIYEHAAGLIGRTPWEVSRDAALLYAAHDAAWQRYRHPLIVVGIDVYNREPEAYGAEVLKPVGRNIPSISRHPCETLESVQALPPLQPEHSPLIRATLEAGVRLQANCPEAHVRIPVCGPFALGIGLLGMDELLMSVIEDPDALKAALAHLLEGQSAYLSAIHAAGLQPIIFESGTTPPLLPVDAFIAIEAPLLADLFDRSRALFGTAPACVIGGDAAQVAEPLMRAGPGWVIAPSETDQTAFLDHALEFPDIHVRVNMQASSLLSASLSDLEAEAMRCAHLAASRPNCSVGCGVVPFETPPATLLHVKSLIESFTTTTTTS